MHILKSGKAIDFMSKRRLAMLFSLHFLDKDGHALVIIIQPLNLTVEEGIRAKHAGIDLGDGSKQLGQIFFCCALVRQKEAVVLAGEGAAKVILQQTGGAHNDG